MYSETASADPYEVTLYSYYRDSNINALFTVLYSGSGHKRHRQQM